MEKDLPQKELDQTTLVSSWFSEDMTKVPLRVPVATGTAANDLSEKKDEPRIFIELCSNNLSNELSFLEERGKKTEYSSNKSPPGGASSRKKKKSSKNV